MVQLMMFTVPPEMAMPPPCEQLERSGSFLEMSSIGALWWALWFETGETHNNGIVLVNVSCSDRHDATIDEDAPTLPN